MRADAATRGARKVRITVGLEAGDYDALVALSEEEERSLSWLVAQAVRQFLAGRKEDFQYQLHLQPSREP